jgi:hypothetical protein
MAGFQAEGVVDPLDYDFKPYVKASGTIPEPTDKQVGEFLSGIKKIIKDMEAEVPSDIDPADTAAILAAIDDLDPAKTIEQMARMCKVYADLCSGTPTEQEIADLPMRIRSIFFQWLQSEVMSPEAAAPVGNGQVRKLPTARGA